METMVYFILFSIRTAIGKHFTPLLPLKIISSLLVILSWVSLSTAKEKANKPICNPGQKFQKTFVLGPATLAIHPSARAMLGRPSRALVPLVGFGLFIIRTKVLNAILCPYRQRYSLGLGCTRSQSHLEEAVEDDGHQHSRRCTCHRPDDFDL